MKTELIVALIAGAVALLSAVGTIWSSIRNSDRSDANERALAELRIEYDKLKIEAERQKEIANFSEPLARSAYDLQSRLYNILRNNLLSVYVVNGNNRERSYVIDNTAFVVGQYLCWTELVRREIQFIDLGEDEKTRELLRLQDTIFGLWQTDRHSSIFRIFAGEQRAIGEAFIQTSRLGPECMGYGAFLKAFSKGINPLIDALRSDVVAMGNALEGAQERLVELQHALIDLLEMLDPEYLRFPRHRRSKVNL